MAKRISADEAAARVRPDDSLGIPLATGQPPALMETLGRRDDWTELHVYGALLAGTALFNHPERALPVGLLRADRARAARCGGQHQLRAGRLPPLRAAAAAAEPAGIAIAAAPPDEDGWCSLSLHAGAFVGELARAGADPDRLLVVEASDRFPRTFGLPPEHPHAVHVDGIDLLVESDAAPIPLP